MLETLEISLFGSQDLKKVISSHFFPLRKLSRDPTKWAPIFCWTSRGAQNAPRELPGTPKDHPGPPDDPLGRPCAFQFVHLRKNNRRLSGFTYISTVFYQSAGAKIPLQIRPFQLLHIFSIYFHNSIQCRHLPESPLGLSGYPPRPSRTSLRAPRDPKAYQRSFAHYQKMTESSSNFIAHEVQALGGRRGRETLTIDHNATERMPGQVHLPTHLRQIVLQMPA